MSILGIVRKIHSTRGNILFYIPLEQYASNLDAMSVKCSKHTALAILVSNLDAMSVNYLKHTARAICVILGLRPADNKVAIVHIEPQSVLIPKI